MNDFISDILEDSCNILHEKFDGGIELTSTALKAYSGPALEEWSELTIKLIILSLSEKYPNASIELDSGYIESDFDGFCDERLDQHVKVNGKYVYLQEDRAWIDKPFYTMKRAVIRNIMISCKSKLSDNVKFGMVGYSIDIKDNIISTCDYTQGYGNHIKHFSLTGRQRSKKVNGKTVNWFETGFSVKNVEQYINYVYSAIEDSINE